MNQDEFKVCDNAAQAGVFAMGQYDSRFDALKSGTFDPQTLWDRVNGDMELLQELVAIFLDEYPTLLQSIATAIQQKSFEQVLKSSHKLKGSALQFSGTGVGALAASLEQMGREKSLQDAEQVFSDLERETIALTKSLQSMISGKDESAD